VAGKKSLPVVFGLQNKQRFAERWLSGSIPVDEVADLAELLRTEGADDYARSCVAQLTKEALAALERSAQPSAGKAALIQLAESLINRLY
jgi:geranylgeranyl pyrophosphate synthase